MTSESVEKSVSSLMQRALSGTLSKEYFIEYLEILKNKEEDTFEDVLKCILYHIETVEEFTLESPLQWILELGFVPHLVKMLSEFNLGDSCNIKILKIFREITLSELGREMLVANSGIPVILKCLVNGPPDQRCMAIRVTFNISVVSPNIRNELAKGNVLSYLVQAVSVVAECQCAAIGTIANLATEADTKRILVTKFGVLKPLVNVLDSRDYGVLTHACRALFALAANDENKLDIKYQGGLVKLVECLELPCEQVRMNATGALANLAIHPSNKPDLVEAGILPHLRMLAVGSTVKMQRQVARCLFALAAHVQNRKFIVEEKCLSALVALVDVPNEEVQVNAAGAIGNIAMSDEFKMSVVESGALEHLIALSRDGSIKIQRQVSRALFTLSSKDYIKGKLVELHGVQVLVSLAASPSEDIQRDAIGTIANLSIGGEYRDTLMTHGVLPCLIPLLESPRICVQRQATRAVFALSGCVELQELILESGVLDILVRLSKNLHNEVLKHSLGAMANLALYKPQHIVATGLVEYFIELTQLFSNFELRRQAVRCITNLLGDSPLVSNHLGDYCRYAGVVGEQARLRNDFRKLFELLCAGQNLENSVVKESDIPHMIPEFETPRRLSILEQKGRKRSCEDLLVDFNPFGNPARVSNKIKTSGTENDCILLLPLLSSSVEMSDVFHPHQIFIFMAHSCIVTARCELMLHCFEESVSKNGATTQDIYIEIPRKYASSQRAWLTVLEYMYSDSLRQSAVQMQDDTEFVDEVLALANNLKLSRIIALVSQFRPNVWTTEESHSTWTADFSMLLTSPTTRYLPNLTDATITLSAEFQSAVPNPSPRHANFAFPGSPQCMDMNSKRLKTADKTFARSGSSELDVFSVHKVLLATRCPYFNMRFQMHWNEKEVDSTVTFDGTREALKLILRYIYCGLDKSIEAALQVDPSLTLQVLVIANEYQLEGLQCECENYLLPWVNPTTVWILLEEIETMNTPILKVACLYCCLVSNHLKPPETIRESIQAMLQETAARWGVL